MVVKLGALREVDLRSVWAHEQYGLSRWLAREENLALLGQTLNLSLTDVEAEKFVGAYRCDLFCRDELTQKVVLIENQLEPTNHDHLGKLITYASGLDAGVVVWIVSAARPEHSSAIEWLNNHTIEGVDFFLLELHLYAIDHSAPAPKFEIIAQPNSFAKSTKLLASRSNLQPRHQYRHEFWTQLNDAILAHGKPFNTRKPSIDNVMQVAVGSSLCSIAILLLNSAHIIRVSFRINNAKGRELFDLLYSHRVAIEQAMGAPLEWLRQDEKLLSEIRCPPIQGLDFAHHENYPELMEKTIHLVLALHDATKAFLPWTIDDSRAKG